MLPSGWLKFAGTILLILGTGIAGTLIYVMWWMAGVMLHNSDPDAVNHFNGTPLTATGIFALLAAVAMIGVTYVAIGIWWVLRGTRSRLLIQMGVLGYLIVTVGFALLQWWSN
jgi:hypothetical protein